MRYLVLALSLYASAAYAQQPNGIINAPIYATGYISVAGGTDVATKIPAQPNHPANQNVYLTSAVTGTWSIQLPNPAFEGQVLSFNCGAAVSTISVTSSDGSTLDPAIPTSCGTTSGFLLQFDLRANIWRNIGSGNTAVIPPTSLPAFTGDCTTTAGSVSLNCTKTGGVSFAPSATTDTTNATNITSGTLSTSRLPLQVQIGGAPVVGALSFKASAAGHTVTAYSENYSITDDQGSPTWNTPNYWTCRDIYQGTRGVGHGDPSQAGDGNGCTLDFQSWSRSGAYKDAFAINGGLASAASGAEQGGADFNCMLNGVFQGCLGLWAGGVGLAGPAFIPGGTGTWNLGDTTHKWLNGWFAGQIVANSYVASGISYLTTTATTNLIGNSASPTVSSDGTGTPTISSGATLLAGTVTGATNETHLTITWPYTKSVAPVCVVSSPNGSGIGSYIPSTTNLVIIHGTATGTQYSYICTGD